MILILMVDGILKEKSWTSTGVKLIGDWNYDWECYVKRGSSILKVLKGLIMHA